MENTNHSHQVAHHPEAEEFINSDPNHSSNSDRTTQTIAPGKMPKIADTDPNRYSNFNTDDTGSERGTSLENKNENNSNDSNSNYSGIPQYSVEEERYLGRKSWDTEEEDEKNTDHKKVSESDIEDFFEGL